MILHPALLAFVALYLGGTLCIGWWSSRKVKTTNDFVLAARQMPLAIVTTEMFADWFGSETIMGASAQFAESGFLGVIEDPFGAALCLLLIGLFLVRKLYNLNLRTFSNFYTNRFHKNVGTLSAWLMIPADLGWVSAQFVALGYIVSSICPLTNTQSIIICAAFVMLYTYIGGMRAIAYTDFIEAIMIIFGLAIILFFMVNKAGGIQNVLQHTPARTFQFFPDVHLKNVVEYFVAWITVGFGSLPQQDVFQRIMSARTQRIAVRGALIACFMYLTFALMPLFITLIGRQLYPNLLSVNDNAQNFIPQMVLIHGNLFIQMLFFGALISGIMSTSSSGILSSSTIIGENLIRPLYKNISDKKLLRIMRLAVIGITILCVLIATRFNNIYELVGYASGLGLVSLFTPLIAGLYWKAANTYGAIASMVFGLFVWVFCVKIETEYPPLFFGFITSIISMIVFSLAFRRKIMSSN